MKGIPMLCRPLAVAAVLAIASGFVTSSRADLVVYTDLTSWESAVQSGYGHETFEGTNVDIDFTHSPETSPNGDLGLSAIEESSFSNNMLIDAAADGGFESAGANFNSSNAVLSLRFLNKNPVDAVTVTFPAGVSAFAFDFNIYDNQGDSVDIEFAGTNGSTLGTFSPSPVPPPNPSEPNVGFLGVIDTGVGATITSLTVSANRDLGDGTSTFASFDNIRYGIAAIPEPTATLSFGLILSGLGATLHRRVRDDV